MKFIVLAFIALAGTTEAVQLRKATPNWPGFDWVKSDRAEIDAQDAPHIAAYKNIHQKKLDAVWKYDMGPDRRCKLYAPCDE